MKTLEAKQYFLHINLIFTRWQELQWQWWLYVTLLTGNLISSLLHSYFVLCSNCSGFVSSFIQASVGLQGSDPAQRVRPGETGQMCQTLVDNSLTDRYERLIAFLQLLINSSQAHQHLPRILLHQPDKREVIENIHIYQLETFLSVFRRAPPPSPSSLVML